MTDLITLAGFVGQSLMTNVFGHPYIAGAFVMLIFVWMLNKAHASLSSYAVVLIPLGFLLVGLTAFAGVGSGEVVQLLPKEVIFILLMLVSGIILLAMYKFFRA